MHNFEMRFSYFIHLLISSLIPSFMHFRNEKINSVLINGLDSMLIIEDIVIRNKNFKKLKKKRKIWFLTSKVCLGNVVKHSLSLPLACVAQWIGCWPANWKVTSSIPSQGTFLDCSPGPQLGACKRQPCISHTLMFLSLSLSLLSPLSKRVNK